MAMFYRCTLENKLQNVRPDEIEGDVIWGRAECFYWPFCFIIRLPGEEVMYC